mgnify:CR=1 FL=1
MVFPLLVIHSWGLINWAGIEPRLAGARKPKSSWALDIWRQSRK